MARKAISAESLGLKNSDQKVPQIVATPLDASCVPRLNVEIVSDKVVVLDASKAAEYIDLPIFPGERIVQDDWVQRLYDEMRKGTFNEKLVVLSTAVLDGVTYKVNGQHTSWAIVYMPPNYSIDVREIRYKVKDKTQLKLVYSTYDRLNVRTDTHISKVILVDTPVMDGIPTTVLAPALGGLRLWLYAERREQDRVTPDQMATLVQKDYPELFRRVALCFQQHRQYARSLMPQGVMAALYATFDKLPTKADEFWTPVLAGTGLDSRSDARWRLRKLLLSIAESKAKARSDKVKVTREELFTLCCVA